MRTFPDIGLLINSLLQDVRRFVETCAFLAVYMNIRETIKSQKKVATSHPLPPPTKALFTPLRDPYSGISMGNALAHYEIADVRLHGNHLAILFYY